MLFFGQKEVAVGCLSWIVHCEFLLNKNYFKECGQQMLIKIIRKMKIVKTRLNYGSYDIDRQIWQTLLSPLTEHE